eukprot:4424203-Prymnesium_polylepis.1
MPPRPKRCRRRRRRRRRHWNRWLPPLFATDASVPPPPRLEPRHLFCARSHHGPSALRPRAFGMQPQRFPRAS